MQTHTYKYAKAKLENGSDNTISLFLTTKDKIKSFGENVDIWQEVE